MAAAIYEALGIEAELQVGERGEFTVAVDGREVARKTFDGFPSEEACVEAVRDAISG